MHARHTSSVRSLELPYDSRQLRGGEGFEEPKVRLCDVDELPSLDNALSVVLVGVDGIPAKGAWLQARGALATSHNMQRSLVTDPLALSVSSKRFKICVCKTAQDKGRKPCVCDSTTKGTNSCC